MSSGWIKIHRQMLKWEWYDDMKTFRLFIHLLLNANHETRKWRGITINSGELVTGRKKLSKELRISERSIRTSLSRLKSTNEVTIKSTSRYSLIKLNNWDQYQQTTNKTTSKRPANDQQTTTNKKYKNVKNDKKEILKCWNEIKFNSVQKNSIIKSGVPVMRNCTNLNEDMEDMLNGFLKKYSVEKIKKAISGYAKDIANRKPLENGYHEHRWYFIEFLKRKNGLSKFLTSV